MESSKDTDEDLTGQIGAAPTCSLCGAGEVVRDAWVIWNPVTGVWELKQIFEQVYCEACEQAPELVWKKQIVSRTEIIRRLNDALRTGASDDGTVVITSGIQGMGPEFIARVGAAVRAFDAFTPDNDPHLEHDFGALDVDGERVFFKHDYYDLSMTALSPDPTDPKVTHRVLTIMLASEY